MASKSDSALSQSYFILKPLFLPGVRASTCNMLRRSNAASHQASTILPQSSSLQHGTDAGAGVEPSSHGLGGEVANLPAKPPGRMREHPLLIAKRRHFWLRGRSSRISAHRPFMPQSPFNFPFDMSFSEDQQHSYNIGSSPADGPSDHQGSSLQTESNENAGSASGNITSKCMNFTLSDVYVYDVYVYGLETF